MNVHYCKQLRNEGETYQTWKWTTWEEMTMAENPDNYGWNKIPVPFFSSGEVAGNQLSYREKIVKNAKEWFAISNKEDLIFLNKESDAFSEWFRKNRDEILNSL